MKTNLMRYGAAWVALGICAWVAPALAQTSTIVTTTKGAFTEYVPGSETVVVRTDTNTAPVRYVVTRQTTVVDESGAPVAIERISPGSQLSIQYTGTVASRIIVQRPVAAVSAPVSAGAPAVTQEQTTTTTSTTRPMTHDEKHALKEERKQHKKEAKKEIEREKDALDKAKDKLDDDDND